MCKSKKTLANFFKDWQNKLVQPRIQENIKDDIKLTPQMQWDIQYAM